MAGRAYLYALGAGGERGVDRVLGWFADDVRRTMTLLGSGSAKELDRGLLDFSADTDKDTR
jgi:L-lactate dehydrogenase (cytochrome)